MSRYAFSAVVSLGTALLFLSKVFPRLLQFFSIPFLLVSTYPSGNPPSLDTYASHGPSLSSFFIRNTVLNDGTEASVTIIPGVLHPLMKILHRLEGLFSFWRSSPAGRTAAMPSMTSTSSNDEGGVGFLTRFLLSSLFALCLNRVRERLSSSPSSSSPSSFFFFFNVIFCLLKILSSKFLHHFHWAWTALSSVDLLYLSVDEALRAIFLLIPISSSYSHVLSAHPVASVVLPLISSAIIKRMIIFCTQQQIIHEASFPPSLVPHSLSLLLDERRGSAFFSNRNEGDGESGLSTRHVLLHNMFLRIFTIRRDYLDYTIYILMEALQKRRQSGAMKRGGEAMAAPLANSLLPHNAITSTSSSPNTSSRTEMSETNSLISPSVEGEEEDRVRDSFSSPSTLHALLSFVNSRGCGFNDVLFGFCVVMDASLIDSSRLLPRLTSCLRHALGHLFWRQPLVVLPHKRFLWLHLQAQLKSFLPLDLWNAFPQSVPLPTYGASSFTTLENIDETMESSGGGEDPATTTTTVYPSSSLDLPTASSSSSDRTLSEGGQGERNNESTAFLVPVSMDYFLSTWNRIAFFTGGMLIGYAFLASRFLFLRILELLLKNEKGEVLTDFLGISFPLRIQRNVQDLQRDELKRALLRKEVELRDFVERMEKNLGSSSASSKEEQKHQEKEKREYRSSFSLWGRRENKKLADAKKMISLLKHMKNIDVECCVCPITLCLMEDPVTTCDGLTYDARAIRKWLEMHHTSPLTNIPLANFDLTPNKKVKRMVQLVVKVLSFQS